MDWLDFIDIMVLDEKAAKAKYKQAGRIATDPRIKELFRKLAYEEDIHMAVLQKFKKDIQASTTRA
ncbi:MAG: hypothetical protein HY671_08490 [Chloroflexi bacterium]|nr:hypothetical protein [Chloroflexota bacterium]